MSDAAGLQAVRSEVERALALLRPASPAALDESTTVLENAVTLLRAWRARGATTRGDAGAIREAQRLAGSVRRASQALRSAGEYHAGWLATVGSLTAGYTASGRAGETEKPIRVCFEG